MSTRTLSIALLLAACSTPQPSVPDATAADAFTEADTGPRPDAGLMLDPAPAATLTHALPAIDLPAGAELLDRCQSWTLNNADPLYVNTITMDAGPGWHHSNWLFVPDTQFIGPDGTFACGDRMFNELVAGLSRGSGVFFAQSTQATHEVQQFLPGAAYEIPPHSRVIGAIHVFNLTSAPVSTQISFRIDALASSDVTTLLHPLAIDNRGIVLAPHATTTTDISCNLAAVTRGAHLAARVHYVLPHYHGLATGFQVFAVGGANDGALIYGTSTGIGDPLGSRLATPFDLTGATGMRMACTYTNPGDVAVAYGVHRTDEMCVMLAYVDGPFEYAAGSTGTTTTAPLPDGSTGETTPCIAVSH